uniref:6-phosphogluconate dehydrogenase NAD-binding n=1 Tax=mine drainage metagenome TaxID=410659 RepID=E6PJ54_9ZZZZ
MGANIALRLHDLGYAIPSVYDIDATAAERLSAQVGAVVAARPAELTPRCDIVLTAVSDDAAMLHAFDEGPDSLLRRARGRTFVNCATVAPATHIEVERRARAAGAEALEACMASSIVQAREGSLYLMIGGDRALFERCEPFFRDISSALVYVGEAGRAAALKALVNMVMNANTAALAEGLGLADALGLDLNLVLDVFAQTGAESRVRATDGLDMLARDHDTYFSAEHAAKDSGIALDLAREVQLSLPVAQATHRQYERLKRIGLGALDKSAISELTFRSRHAGDDA